MIRLNPSNDKLSELRLSALPGVVRGPEAVPDATVAMVVPYFLDVLADHRLGTNNLYVDGDGITRRYHVYRDIDGWGVYSLPANVVLALGGEMPDETDILLNWRGRPPAYTAVSFHSLYQRLLKEQQPKQDEFAGKIIIIGSTAPSLFDLKPTPVSQNHPGLEILATALDNLKNQDYLTEMPRWIYLLVTIAALALLTISFVYNLDDQILNFWFTVVQTAFLVITYLFLNYSTWFVDLTAPFTAVLTYFAVARLYSTVLTRRRNGHPLFSAALDVGRECQVLLLSCRLLPTEKRERGRIARTLLRYAGLTRYGVAAPRVFKPAPLLYDIYTDTLLFYWLTEPQATCTALQDLTRMLDKSLRAMTKRAAQPALRMALHSVRFTVDVQGTWRQAGKEAFLAALTPASAHDPMVIKMTTAFAATCRECGDIQVPQTLQTVGLQCGN